MPAPTPVIIAKIGDIVAQPAVIATNPASEALMVLRINTALDRINAKII